MKKIAAVFMALLTAVSLLVSCGQAETHMDLYRYDGYLNAQWGHKPEQVIRELGLSKSQVERLDAEQLEGMPEGNAFGYAITRSTMMLGLYLRGYLYFSEGFEGSDQYIGLYRLELQFIEDDYYIDAGMPDVPEGYKLNGADAIREFSARALYNRNTEEGSLEDEDGLWETCRWTPDSTMKNALSEKRYQQMEEKLSELFGAEKAAGWMEAPLSESTLYYGNENGYPRIVFEGIPAALLYWLE